MKKINLVLLSLVFIILPVLKVNAFSLYYDETHKNNIVEVKVNIAKNIESPKVIEANIDFNSESFELVRITQNNLNWITTPRLIQSGNLFFSGTLNSNDLFTLVFKKYNDGELNLSLHESAILNEDDELYSLQEITSREKSLNIFNITSSTHNDPESWYSNKNVELEWELPSDVQKVKLLIDKNESSYPSVEYTDLITKKNIELDDGVWYFHIRYFGDNGWSPIEHRKIMIDTKKPNLDVQQEENIITLIGQDELSGIDMYEIDIPALNQKHITKEEVFKLPQLKGGVYDIKIIAYDKAQNYVEMSKSLEIKEIDSPHFSGLILGNEELFLLGYVDNSKSKVFASIIGTDSSFSNIIETDNNGKFVYTMGKLSPGLYDLQIVAITDDGVSEENKKIVLVIAEKVVLNPVAIALIVCGLIILIIISFYIFLNKDNKKTNKKKNKKIKK